MPTRIELDYFIANAERIPRPDQDATLTRLHRVTAPRTPRDELFIFAFDHRNPFFDLAQRAGADEARIPKLKQLFVEAVSETEQARGLAGKVGLLCDDRYGQDALNAATARLVDRPTRRASRVNRCSSITAMVGDAGRVARRAHRRVSCSSIPATRSSSGWREGAHIRTLYDAVQVSGHELLLESFRRSRCRVRRIPFTGR